MEVSARLVLRLDPATNSAGEKLLEVKENRMADFPCPNCKYLITQRNSGSFPNFFLEPVLFHEAHKPIDPIP